MALDSDRNDRLIVNKSWLTDLFSTRDADLRSHMITLTYGSFARAMNRLIFGFDRRLDATTLAFRGREDDGGAPPPVGGHPLPNANWFHFATWGTAAVGQNIRSDRLPQRITELPASVRRWIAPLTLRTRSGNGQMIARALTWGQELIALSACSAFLEFEYQVTVARRRGEEPPPFTISGNLNEELLKQLQDENRQWVDAGHLRLITEAMNCYRLAEIEHRRHVNEEDLDRARNSRRTVAHLMLRGTILLTLVEQDVVNEPIRTVIESVPVRLSDSIQRRTALCADRWADIPRELTGLQLPYRLQRQQRALVDAWAGFMTDQLLVLALPAETLRLGRDVPPPSATRTFAAPDLSSPPKVNPHNDEPDDHERATLVQLERLWRLIDAYDRSWGDGRGTAARDWRRLDDRMNWAIALFRSRQQDATLFWPPYSVADTRRIRNGELPTRSADPTTFDVLPPIDQHMVSRLLDWQPAVPESN